MKKRVLLIAGHGAGDSGAIGNGRQEQQLAREGVNLLAKHLAKYADVTIYPQDRNAYYDALNGVLNVGKYDYVLEYHWNANVGTPGTGTEIIVLPSEKFITVEQKIMSKLGAFYKVRGVKQMQLRVLDEMRVRGMSAALLELGFINNANDVKMWDEKKEEISQSIALGIAEGFGLVEGSVTPPVVKPPTTQTPDQIIHAGEVIRLPEIYTVDAIHVVPNDNGSIASAKLSGTPFSEWSYVDATVCTRVDSNGNPTASQTFNKGDLFKVNIPSVRVIAVDVATNGLKIPLGRYETWIKATTALEI